MLSSGDEHVMSLQWDVPEKFLVFLPLVARNARGELEGVLATHWEHSPDYRTWAVHLRNDVRWHDGVPFTAHDVKFTLDLLTTPSAMWAGPDDYDVTVLDDTTYTITYRQFGPGSPLDDWTVYYPRHLLASLDPEKFGEWDFWLAPVGDGPYRHVRTVRKTMMEFAANPDFYRGPPRIQRLLLKFGSPQLTELLSGTVDVLQPNATDVLRAATDTPFRTYYTFWFVNVDAIGWNQTRAPFDDVRVRRAMTLAINRRELQGLLGFPQATPLFDGPFTDRQYQTGQLVPPTAYDPEAAQRLLDEAGWRESDKGSIRAREGQPLRIVLVAGDLFEQPRIGVYLQQQLRQVGVEVEIQQGNLALVARRVRAHDFSAVLLHLPLRGTWSGMRLIEPGSPFGYDSPQAGVLFERTRAGLDPDLIDRAYRDLTLLLQRDVPMTFLAPGVSFTLARADVQGLSSPYQADPFMRAGDLWFEPRR